jgi:hypothetical protein
VTLTDESRSSGLFLNRINYFYFYREILDGTGNIDVRQDSIFSDAIVDPQGLTFLACESGDDLCFFSTILKAAFFNVPGTVLGTGEAICQFGDGTGDLSPRVLARNAIMFAKTTVSGGDVNAGTAIDGFALGDLSVVPKLKGEDKETATERCEVVAYECDEQNQELALPGVAK